MSVLSTVFAEIYDILVRHNQSPMMRRSTFVNWYANSDRLYYFRASLKSLIMVCDKPLNCYVIRDTTSEISIPDEDIQKLNHEIEEVCSRFRKVKAFW